jgi:hypothetical protein
MNEAHELAEALRAVSPEGAVRQPAPEATIAQTEQRLGIHLPADMMMFYRAMNGMDWPTHPDNGWIRFWELGSWRRVRDESALGEASSLYANLADAILVADHCDESWWYAVTFGRDGETTTVHLVDGLQPAKLVATTFTAFVNAALADAAEIYPDEDNAG